MPLVTPPFRHVYVHVPFCVRRCSYCDFSIAVRREVPVSVFVNAIMAELANRRISIDGGTLGTIYLGGGTPSKLGGPGILALLGAIAHGAGVDDFSTSKVEREITLEANPEDVTPELALAWRRAGVNRVSLGVQSFDPGVLSWMHRSHAPGAPELAVQILRDSGISDISLDLIFALPETLDRDWIRDLDLAMDLRPDHLSVYGLTVEPRTPLGRWTARREISAATEERYADEFLEAHRRLSAAGFEHYEVSSYALPGHRSRHNSMYWSGAPYVGLGPSAHGFDGQIRRWNVGAYAEWERLVGTGVDPIDGKESLGPEERSAEEVYLGLRTVEGLAVRPEEMTRVQRWLDAGWANLTGGMLRLNADGWLRLDALAADLTSIRSRS